MRNHPRGVIEKGDQIGFLLATSGFDDGRAVHHRSSTAVRPAGGKSSPVLTSAVGSGMTHQAVLFEQPVRWIPGGSPLPIHALISQLPDDQADRQIGSPSLICNRRSATAGASVRGCPASIRLFGLTHQKPPAR